ncbi:hypothetical protein LCGC14_0831790 [marine sediment metagenome]|uniref:Uncharacterized protein n=1 Tax=marine sediment metagenome TaxID=412755 RepID=A0A0F9PFP9_9ZZZZ
MRLRYFEGKPMPWLPDCRGTGFVMRTKTIRLPMDLFYGEVSMGVSPGIEIEIFDGWKPCPICNGPRESPGAW